MRAEESLLGFGDAVTALQRNEEEMKRAGRLIDQPMEDSKIASNSPSGEWWLAASSRSSAAGNARGYPSASSAVLRLLRHGGVSALRNSREELFCTARVCEQLSAPPHLPLHPPCFSMAVNTYTPALNRGRERGERGMDNIPRQSRQTC